MAEGVEFSITWLSYRDHSRQLWSGDRFV